MAFPTMCLYSIESVCVARSKTMEVILYICVYIYFILYILYIYVCVRVYISCMLGYFVAMKIKSNSNTVDCLV